MRKKDTRLFVQLFHDLLDTPAWRSLSPWAKCLYVSLRRRHNGKNNGRIFVSCRQAAREIGMNKDTATRAFRELVHCRFIIMTSTGHLGADGKGKAPGWRLTEIPTTEEAATMDYLNWDGVPFDPKKARHRSRPKKAKSCPIPSDTLSGPVGHTADGLSGPVGHTARPIPSDISTVCSPLASPQEEREREDESRGDDGLAMAAMTELPVPFASGVLRRRRNRLLLTTMLNDLGHLTGGLNDFR